MVYNACSASRLNFSCYIVVQNGLKGIESKNYSLMTKSHGVVGFENSKLKERSKIRDKMQHPTSKFEHGI